MTGLPDLSKIAVSSHDRAQAKTIFQTMESIEAELEDRGLVIVDTPPPYQRPEITAEQLTTDFNKDYTTLYAQQLAWLNYTNPILAKVKATLLGYGNALKDIEARLRKELREKNRGASKEEKLNENDIDDYIWLDSDHKELTLQKQRYDQKRMMLEAYVETMENNMKVISRQVEIRKIEIGGGNIENRMPNRNDRFPVPRR